MRNFKLPGKKDIIASIVAFVIAIPLSLGISLASGAPPAAGLITCIIGAVVVGAIGGSRFLITAPEASLSALVLQFVQQFGAYGMGVITFLSGILQMIFGALGAGRVAGLIPRPVLYGLLSAVALTLIFGQSHVLLGGGVPRSPWLALTTFSETVSDAWGQSTLFAPPALLCGLLALAIQVLWIKKAGKLAWLPAALPAVLLVTPLSLVWEMPRVEIAPLLPTLQGELTKFSELTWVASILDYLPAAIGLALVASAQSLLSATALDEVTQKRPDFAPANLNRELAACGLGNSLAGALGGLPMTGAMVRSVAALEAGAESRACNVMHGFWVLIALSAAPALIKLVPLTALAAVLMITGTRILNAGLLVRTMKASKLDGAIWVVTTLAILSSTLLIGLGVSLVFVLAVKGLPKLIETSRQRQPNPVRVRLDEGARSR